MRFIPTAFAMAGCLLFADAGAARDLFVDNLAGEDYYSGDQPQAMPGGGGPLKTITRALRLAGPGDRVVLANTGEPYRESLTLVGERNSGFGLQSFTLAGNGAILDGSLPVPPDAWQHFRGAVFRFAPPRLGWQQLFLDGRPARRVPVVGPGDGLPKLEPLEWCYREGFVYFAVEPTKLPDDYRLSYAHLQTGITLYFVSKVAILDLTVQGFHVDGISAANTAREVYLAGVTSRGNGRSGITCSGASRIEIEACLLGNNGASQLLTLPWSETQVRNSHLLGNTAPAWVDRGGRVYVGEKLLRGGLDEIKPADAD